MLGLQGVPCLTPSILKDNLAGYPVLAWYFVLFSLLAFTDAMVFVVVVVRFCILFVCLLAEIECNFSFCFSEVKH